MPIIRTQSGRRHYTVPLTFYDTYIAKLLSVDTFVSEMRDQAFMSQLEKMRQRGIPPAARLIAAEFEPLDVERELSIGE